MPYLPPVSIALPVLTASIGLGGFTVGIYSFVSPVYAALVYGVDLPRLKRASKKSDDPSSASKPENISKHLAYIHATGVRNFVTGLTILGLTWYWQFSDQSKRSSVASLMAQRCLGIVIMVGTVTPVVDAVVTWQAAEQGGETKHGRKAAMLHATRSLVWLAGGLWCLFG
jgi:hypothetical protein